MSFEVEYFHSPVHSLDVVSTIVSLQDYFETIRRTEVDRARRRLGILSREQELAIETLTCGIVNKIMHPPIRALKTAAGDSDATKLLQLVKQIFNLCEIKLQTIVQKNRVPAE